MSKFLSAAQILESPTHHCSSHGQLLCPDKANNLAQCTTNHSLVQPPIEASRRLENSEVHPYSLRFLHFLYSVTLKKKKFTNSVHRDQKNTSHADAPSSVHKLVPALQQNLVSFTGRFSSCMITRKKNAARQKKKTAAGRVNGPSNTGFNC
jgi:hypothetical protein